MADPAAAARGPIDSLATYTVNPGGAALGYAQITDLSSAVGLGDIPAGAQIAVIIAEGAAVRWRDDGTDPTASVGMPLAVGEQLVYVRDLAVLSFIQQTASAKLNVAYYGG